MDREREIARAHTLGVIRAFVLPERRKRYLTLLSSSKLEGGDAVHRLLNDPDMRHAQPVSAAGKLEVVLDRVEALLKSKGAPPECLVLSDCSLDDAWLSLRKGLDPTLNRACSTFVSCMPGRLGFHQPEALPEQYIFERRH